MSNKQKKDLRYLLVGTLLYAVAAAVSLLTEFPWWGDLLLYLIPYLWLGWKVLLSAGKHILSGQVFDEKFLMSIATLGALAIKEFPEAVFVMLFFDVGELFESIAVGKSRRSIAALMDIRPENARVIRQGVPCEVDPEEVQVGETVEVEPGERVPLDGKIIQGHSYLDTSALTGESVPREVNPGDEVISGCINTSGLLRFAVSRPAGESTVTRILNLVENAGENKAKSENFITRFARYYTPAVVLGALALAIIPSLITGEWGEWIARALNFLVVSCPCALVISVPLSFFGGIGCASKNGILIKGSNYMEALAKTGTVVFDKTGTLTCGNFAVQSVIPAPGISPQDLLELCTLAELHSSHPISLSLRSAYGKEPDAARVTDVEEIAGHGIRATVDGEEVLVGNARLMASVGIAETGEGVGTRVLAAKGGKYYGCVLIADSVKPDSADAIAELHSIGVKKTVMLTGDSEEVASAVAKDLGMGEYHAGLLPADKVSHVETLLAGKEEKTTLAFVGDGINDAPVLTRADVGIAMGALGSDAAMEAADVVLMDDRLPKIAKAIRISRRTVAIVRQNIIFALGVKAIILVLSAFGFANMWVASFGDVGVTVIAILNAVRTLKTR